MLAALGSRASRSYVLEFHSQRFLDGCYTPLAIERLSEEIGDSGGAS